MLLFLLSTFLSLFYQYLKEWYPKMKVSIFTAAIDKFKSLGISTKNLIATKGRASFLGERARGHIDPGARSSQLAIEAICNTIINT